MIFAAILAGGIGSRMSGTDVPKQFLPLGNKPVIIHTIEKFVINEKIDKIIVLTPKNFINHTNHLIEEHIGKNDNIIVIEGGKTRNDTLINSIKYIDENFGIDDESIILTHDSVRPFVTHRIIEDNIDNAKKGLYKYREIGKYQELIANNDLDVARKKYIEDFTDFVSKGKTATANYNDALLISQNGSIFDIDVLGIKTGKSVNV